MVSVITVCYNAEREIERTILSVVGQDYPFMEYIIVDGGSNDSTMQIVNRYKDKIHLIVSEPDNGIYDAMNKGIRKARGEWVVLMNAGDTFAESTTLTNVFSMEIPQHISFLYSDVYMRQGGNWLVCPMDFNRGALNHQCVIYKKALHERYGFYIVTKKLIVSDYLFFIQIPSEEVMKTNTVIARYDGGGASSKFNARMDALCADVVFKRRTFGNMLLMSALKTIGDCFPNKVKYVIKKNALR